MCFKLLLLFPGSGSPKVQLLKGMVSLCLTENTLKRARKARSSVATCIYIKIPFLKLSFNWYAFIIQCLVHADHTTKPPPVLQREKKQSDFPVLTHTPSMTTIVHKPQHIYGLLQTHTTGSECGKAILRQHCRDEIPQDQLELSLSFNLHPKSFSKQGTFAERRLSHRQVFLWYKTVPTPHNTSPVGHIWLTANCSY